MKKLFAVFICLFAISFCFAKTEKLSPEEESELKIVYTKFTKASSVEDKAKYCFNPDLSKMRESWSENLVYTPKKFGTIYYNPTYKVYCLIELIKVNSLFTSEIGRFAYFKKSKGEYKIDWDAWVCYNELSFDDFRTIKPAVPVEFRCLVVKSDYSRANLTGYSTYTILNGNAKWEISAVAKNDGIGGKLNEMYNVSNEGKFLRLKIKYDNNLDDYVITDVIQKWWSEWLR